MNRWDRFARENAEFYIWTDPDLDYGTEEGRRRFFETGERQTEQFLSRVQHRLSGWEAALEIGCGTGRLALPHARRFGALAVVDVSPVMLEKLRANAQGEGIENLEIYLPDEAWDAPDRYDYAYSFLVFQHIRDVEVIRRYLARTARALRPGGMAQFQFDTRPRMLSYRLRNLLPDPLLPRTQRRGIRRIRRDPETIRVAAVAAGLQIVEEWDREGPTHTFLFLKPAP